MLVRVPLIALLLTVSLPAASAGAELQPNEGPDVPAVTDPVASVVAFEAELFKFTGSGRTHTVDLPDVEWDRVVLEYHSWPNHPGGDPWDRLLFVAFEQTEVLRGTTPRGDFTLTEDVTEYASVLAGSQLNVTTKMDSWVGQGIYVSITLHFYQEPTVEHVYDAVVSPIRFQALGGPGSSRSGVAHFPDAAPEGAVLEFFTSGHSAEGEFWYQYADQDPSFPTFRILVDGEEVGVVHAQPYVYALLGFDGSEEAWLINQQWWTVFGPTDALGVHYGVGEVPSYRAVVPDELLPLLTGERDVQVVKETHGGYWPTSVNFLLDLDDEKLGGSTVPCKPLVKGTGSHCKYL